MSESPIINNTIREQVYEILKQKILDGTFPEGSRIQEIDVANQLHVSRSPVREALKILDGERFVQSIPNKGIFVRHVTLEDIDGAFELRELLEDFSIRKLCSNATDEEIRAFAEILEQMEQAYRNDENDRYHQCDALLHGTIIHLSKNELLISTNERIFNITHRLRIREWAITNRRQRSIQEHRTIIAALLKRDAEAACTANSLHLRNTLAGIRTLCQAQKP